MKAVVVGIGYIGLPTSAVLADHGVEVVGVDVNREVVEALNRAELTIEEPGLPELVKKVVAKGRLRAAMEPEKADAFIIAVPTPMNADKSPNMDYVREATKAVLPYLEKGNMLILESTSAPLTVTDIMAPMLRERGFKIGEDIYLAHSPERVIPGHVLEELISNDRIIGGYDPVSSEKVADFYKIFVKGQIYQTDSTTAEMCKLTENTFRGMNIAIANQLALISEKLGMNVWELIELANKHPRVNILQPGPGVGGHCIAIDPWFIVEGAGAEADLIKSSMELNESMPYRQFEKIKTILGSLKGKKITFLGMSFKPDIDDYRESPILKIVDLLEEIEGLELAIYDPHIKQYKYLASCAEEAFEHSDLIVLAVQHSEFKNLDYRALFELVREKRLYDMRNYLGFLADQIEGLDYRLLGSSKRK